MTPLEQIRDWQDSEHELGMLQFGDSIALGENWFYRVDGQFIPIALAEADLLCVDGQTGELLVFDHEVRNRVFCHTSKNVAAFVNVADVLTAYFARCVADEKYYDDLDEARRVIAKCAEIAGGEKYAGFYHCMIGA